MMGELVVQGQESGEIRADTDAELIARLLMTGVFYHFMRAHPIPPHPKGASPPEPARLEGDGASERSTRSGLDLEATLIESVDKLMDGLGGPDWRQR
jgi:hypothetical protein